MNGESPDAFLARMDAKAAKQRYFTGLELAAFEARVNPKKPPAPPRPAKAKRVTLRSGVPRIVRPTHCTCCGREMRSGHEELREGTIRYGAGGKCATCYGRPYTEQRKMGPPNCLTCERPMRHTGQLLEDHPGTVKHVGNGLCGKCTNRQGRTDIVEHSKPPSDCVDCGKPMRTSNQRLADFPGTTAHRGQGVCDGCTKKRKRAGTWIPKAMVS